jgi:type II secretory ATPase GspE/PulE/Tfp pilus assembly ATPase PilB-like protein
LPISQAVADLPSSTFDPKDYFSKGDNVYAGKGCNVCSGSGYQGRTALFEIIEVTPEMQELMLHSPSTREIEALARKQGSRPMFEDGIAKVKHGTTTIAEVMRVVPPVAAKRKQTNGKKK